MSIRHATAEPAFCLSLPDPTPFVNAILDNDQVAAKWIAAIAEAVGERTKLDGFRVIASVAEKPFNFRKRNWQLWCASTQNRIRDIIRWHASDPWVKKCSVFATCLRLRGKDAQKLGRDLRQWRYSTHDWSSCIARLLNNANVYYWRGRNDPWKRWTMTCSKNANRRMERHDARCQA